MAESKKAFTARLEGDGRWRTFIELRETLKSELGSQHPDWNHTEISKEAWDRAKKEFPPGEQVTVSGSLLGGKEVPLREFAQFAARVASAVPTPPAGIEPPAKSPAERKPAELQIDPAKFAGKKASVRATIDWVFENLPLANVEIDSAPGAGAIGLWQWARQASNRQEFYRLWGQTAKGKSDLEDELKRMQDDGGVLSLIDQFVGASERAKAAAAPVADPLRGFPPRPFNPTVDIDYGPSIVG